MAFHWIAEPPAHALVFEVFPIVLRMRAKVSPRHLSGGLAQLHIEKFLLGGLGGFKHEAIDNRKRSTPPLAFA